MRKRPKLMNMLKILLINNLLNHLKYVNYTTRLNLESGFYDN